MSDDQRNRDKVERRVDRLEDRLDRIERKLDRLIDDRGTDGTVDASPPGVSSSPSTPAAESTDSTEPDDSESTDWLRPENWVDKIGIALLLVGLAFLYRWTVEHGLLTPVIRVGFGLAVGVGLGIAGWKIRQDRHRLSQIMLGAASVAFYITLYSAHYFYELLPYAVAFGAMTAVVVATFIVANAERDPALAVVAAIGGFATPLLLSSDGNIPGLMTYNAVLVVGMTAIYIARGWRLILGLTALGAWSFVIYATAATFFAGLELDYVMAVEVQSRDSIELRGGEQWYIQASLLITWFCVGIVPTIRLWLTGITDKYRVNAAAFLAAGSAVAGFALTIWNWENPTWLWIGMSVSLAAGCALAAHYVRGQLPDQMVSCYRVLAALFVAAALVELTPDGQYITGVAALAVAVHYLAARLEDLSLAFTGHALMVPVVFYIAAVVTEPSSEALWPFLNADGAQGALLVGSLFAIVAITHRLDTDVHGLLSRFFYRYGAHGAVLAYIYGQAMVPGWGDVLVSTLWGAYAVALLLGGVLGGRNHLKRAGLLTVLVTVTKLVVVDLQAVDTQWRIALFMGFGAALVAISYFWPRLAGLADAADDSSATG